MSYNTCEYMTHSFGLGSKMMYINNDGVEFNSVTN